MILASRNRHKVRELGEMLPRVDLLPLPDEIAMPPESGSTFEENALIKARAAREATGEIVLAEDSGLEVDGLDGRPGVFSARYAGDDASDEENLEQALADLAESGGPETARYVCVIALVGDGGEHLFRATCEGRLIRERRGEGGFGYDPAFVPEATGDRDPRTMAELPAEEKNAISHRGAAARMLARHLGR